MLALDDWVRKKKRIEELQRQADKVEAGLKLAMEEIKEKDGVTTLKQAKARLVKLVKRVNGLHKEWIELDKQFTKKHGNRLK